MPLLGAFFIEGAWDVYVKANPPFFSIYINVGIF
jgi:hypothetical protein